MTVSKSIVIERKRLLILIGALLGICLLALVMFFVGQSYAYFSAEINETNSNLVSVSTANITIEYDGGSAIDTGSIAPGWSTTKTFNITNHNTVMETYNLVWKEVINTFANNADLVYTITGPYNKGETYLPLGDGGILANLELAPEQTHTYTLTINYVDRGQLAEQNATFYGLIKATKEGEEIREDGIANQAQIQELINTTIDTTFAKNYPVGTIHISTSSTNPATYFGFGTWVAWGNGKVLTGVDTAQTEFATVEKTGGAKAYSILITNLPSHTHSIPALSGSATSAGGHTHPFLYGGYALIVEANTNSWVSGYGYGINQSTNTTENAYRNVNKGYSPIDTAGAHTHPVTTTASTTGGTGSGTAFSVLQPYITAYMWKRVS